MCDQFKVHLSWHILASPATPMYANAVHKTNKSCNAGSSNSSKTKISRREGEKNPGCHTRSQRQGLQESLWGCMSLWDIQDTIQNWWKGTHGPALKTQKKRGLLSDDQEQVLCDWILFSVEIGEAMSKCALHAKAAEMSETLLDKSKKKHKKHLPSECWVYRFLGQNPWLALKQPTGLNAVHA